MRRLNQASFVLLYFALFAFYRAMHYSANCKARSWDRMSSVRPSVCLSVTLMDCDDIGWNSSKIISPLVSLGRLLSADPNMTGLLQGEHPEIFARIGVGYFWRTKALISVKRGKIGPRLLSLLMRTNRKS